MEGTHMEENTNVQSNEQLAQVSERPSGGKRFKAALKEKGRKIVVYLKRNTHVIPLIITLITSFVYLCLIGTYSVLVENNSGISESGITVFVNALASILILPLFLNAFPKRKKPNKVYIVAVFVVFALIIAMDSLFYVRCSDFMAVQEEAGRPISGANSDYFDSAFAATIVHLVFVSISVVVFALMPLYKMGLNKINTKKVLESNKFEDAIDTSEEV